MRLLHRSPTGSRVYELGRLELYLVKRPRDARFSKITLRLGRRMLELTWR